MRTTRVTPLALVVFGIALIVLAVPAQAQAPVSSGDIQRLQDNVYDIGSDIARLRSRDARQADQLQSELDALREEVIYLKVKLQKEGSVQPSEYSDLRSRLENVRARARGDSSTGAAPAERVAPVPAAVVRGNEVPVGAEVDVRLQKPLSSGTAQVEDRFEATTMVDLSSDKQVLIPAGSSVRGVVTSVTKAGRVERTGRLTLSFDQLTIRNRSYPIRATVTQALQSEGYRGDAGKIAAGAGIGAIIGGIIGGFRGAMAGILIGGGGTVAATEGQDVDLPPGTVLRLRFDSPLVIQ
jgi:hypothetical protein